MTDNIENSKSLLVCGESGHGKSASLMGLADRDDVLYLNCEGGKPLPFKNNFTRKVITDPAQVYKFYDAVKNGNTGGKTFNIIVTDTLTFLMDQFESQYVLPAHDTMKGWSNYQEFAKNLMLKHVAESPAFSVFLAHVNVDISESGDRRAFVPVKGALKTKGLEAFFTTVVSATRIATKELTENDLLNITEDEEMLRMKHCFQTRVTRNTISDRIRSPMGLFSKDETYIDNDVSLVIQRLKEYYR